jgi:cytochrome c551/c552
MRLTVTAAVLGISLVLIGRVGSIFQPHAGDPRTSLATTPLPAAVDRVPTSAADISPEALTAVVQRTCVACHNDAALTGNLSLQSFDVAAADKDAETAERMIRKLRAGMMPPPGIPRPAGDTMLALVETIENVIDKAATRNPNPGVRTFQRLNRAEYEQATRELLAIDVDAGNWLPLDTKSENFDNIADEQAMSATLLNAFLNAASDISRLAVGDADAPSTPTTYPVSMYISQHAWERVEGAPLGTRGGVVVTHHFPADGEYVFNGAFIEGNGSRFEDLEIAIDGERVALIELAPLFSGGTNGNDWNQRTEPIFVRAGQRQVSAAFIRRFEGPTEDMIQPHGWSLATNSRLPHLKALTITGPQNSRGVSETPSRSKIFSCRPTTPADERPCVEDILSRLASEAFRQPVSRQDLDGLLEFYRLGAEGGGFEAGIRSGVQAILASPLFVFRVERQPENVKPGEAYRLSDLDLASRLSFFLWGTPPDEELLEQARRGRLSDARELERQTRRMLADRRAEALGTRFAYQWLRIQDLRKVQPDQYWYPNYTTQLGDDMIRETVAFFNHLVQEDRSALDLFGADYTFVNERLAEHYGILGVVGNDFQRVAYPDETRRGILGQGSMLVQTSLANRTSPVLRGKWVMEVLLGTPPPPPPPGVPDLEQTAAAQGGKVLTTRERMERHRSSPTCYSCHQFMDPIGLALDNFDVTGKWRIKENGAALDTRGNLYDGTAISNPTELTQALLARPIPLLRNFTHNLMAYALGRRVEYFDQPAVRRVVRDAEKNDYRMSSFILGVVKSDAFRMKQAPATAQSEGRQN